MSSSTSERSTALPCKSAPMPSTARCTFGGGAASRASGQRFSSRARVASSRASGSCNRVTPAPPHTIPQWPIKVSKSANSSAAMYSRTLAPIPSSSDGDRRRGNCPAQPGGSFCKPQRNSAPRADPGAPAEPPLSAHACMRPSRARRPRGDNPPAARQSGSDTATAAHSHGEPGNPENSLRAPASRKAFSSTASQQERHPHRSPASRSGRTASRAATARLWARKPEILWARKPEIQSPVDQITLG